LRLSDSTAQQGEITTGVRSVLSLAPAYRLAQKVLGAERFRNTIVSQYIKAGPGDRMLDIGCGTADILEHLPNLDYVGFDPSPRYVSDASARFGPRGVFITSTADQFGATKGERTIVIALGVLHHTDDEAAAGVLALAQKALQPGGRFLAVDPTLVDGQHAVARLLVSRDRGLHVRSPRQTETIVRATFPKSRISVRHDLLRTPYSHVIVEAVS